MRKSTSNNVLRRTPVRWLLVAILLHGSIASQVVFACSCGILSLEDRYESNDNVFTALITGGEETSERVVGTRLKLKTYFDVTETFKGTIQFNYFSSHADGNACGISLQVGVEYLIFAPDTGEIGLCLGIVPVSRVLPQDEAIGPKYVAALRSFKLDQSVGLADPWQFGEYQGVCRLSGRFTYREPRSPGVIGVTYWARVPESVAPNPDKPHLKAGFAEMSIWISGSEDLTSYPLTLTVGDGEYVAQWSKDEYSRARYLVNGDDVPSLMAQLVDSTVIRLQSSHPTLGEIDADASLVNAGDSVARMHTCIISAVGDQTHSN